MLKNAKNWEIIDTFVADNQSRIEYRGKTNSHKSRVICSISPPKLLLIATIGKVAAKCLFR